MAVDLAQQIKDLQEASIKRDQQIGTLTKSFSGLVDQLKKTPANGQPSLGSVFGLPNIRDGENMMGSRGFSFMKMLGLVTGSIEPEDAKIECDIHSRLYKSIDKYGTGGYKWAGVGSPGKNKFMAPLATSYLEDCIADRAFRQEMKSLVFAGMSGSQDLPDEMQWVYRKAFPEIAGMYGRKDLSWLNNMTGGALVPPPEFGELIELLRNKEALVNAGARTVPLPPQGRIKYPRQTSPSSTYWVGENKAITQSEIGTGEVSLEAKKLAVLIKMPNELIRFASPAAEALVRDDMTKSLALGLDLAGLEGVGGDTQPRGIINHPNINTITSSIPGADGDRIVAQDIYRMVAVVEESNAEFESWIMRPKTLFKYYQLRADAVAQGDGSGLFLFNLIREPGEGMQAKPSLAGYPVVKSTQVSQVQSKGTSTNLTYVLAGMFSDVLIGMFGAIEFASTALGDSSFTADQTWVRGILSSDIAIRHEGAFAYLPSLLTTL